MSAWWRYKQRRFPAAQPPWMSPARHKNLGALLADDPHGFFFSSVKEGNASCTYVHLRIKLLAATAKRVARGGGSGNAAGAAAAAAAPPPVAARSAQQDVGGGGMFSALASDEWQEEGSDGTGADAEEQEGGGRLPAAAPEHALVGMVYPPVRSPVDALKGQLARLLLAAPARELAADEAGGLGVGVIAVVCCSHNACFLMAGAGLWWWIAGVV